MTDSTGLVTESAETLAEALAKWLCREKHGATPGGYCANCLSRAEQIGVPEVLASGAVRPADEAPAALARVEALHPYVAPTRCRYREAEPENPPPGPPDPPMWCTREQHSDDRHEFRHATSPPIRLRNPVLGRELRGSCGRCHVAWPCEHAAALSEPKP